MKLKPCANNCGCYTWRVLCRKCAAKEREDARRKPAPVCPRCGKQVSSHAGHCRTCAQVERRARARHGEPVAAQKQIREPRKQKGVNHCTCGAVIGDRATKCHACHTSERRHKAQVRNRAHQYALRVLEGERLVLRFRVSE